MKKRQKWVQNRESKSIVSEAFREPSEEKKNFSEVMKRERKPNGLHEFFFTSRSIFNLLFTWVPTFGAALLS